ncbi:uncharacterized protein ACA1_007310 [Acanthamoeba castellanii str. Neff]|uniref:Rad4/PNGase transglutaminase-like fold domain-containing protein n=1 Tax=Acanthamoeba castellanii (strain ATCC 30010 / Neff) TaxID=1257118 RepID=L8HJ47_ACACF|nr:uncharacterized protein ACA1_007310 [Acanthamoeba castellanii str. Neff]ELR24431.1 hypothetical protein ACA1_007310 [Acanthamoeba castellanii str. Neff]
MGYPTRMVIDWTDHVWVEVYSHNQERWVHADPCESAYDKPLLYEAGWGKKLSYVVAISKDEAIDVIHRYTRQWDQVLSRRTLVPEDVFAQVVDWLDRQLRQRAQLDTAATAVHHARTHARTILFWFVSCGCLMFRTGRAEGARLNHRSSRTVSGSAR